MTTLVERTSSLQRLSARWDPAQAQPTAVVEQTQQERRNGQRDLLDTLRRNRNLLLMDRWHKSGKKRSESSRKSLCGKPQVPKGDIEADAQVAIKITVEKGQRKIGYAGLYSCGSVWTCPTCALKISAVRAEETKRVMKHVLKDGGYAAAATFTVRHKKKHGLAEVWDLVADAWHGITSGAAWYGRVRAVRDCCGEPCGGDRDHPKGKVIKDEHGETIKENDGSGDQRQYGLLGWIKATEVTHGRNGWHVHIHSILLYDHRPPKWMIEALAGRMWGRWEGTIAKINTRREAEGKTTFGVPEKDNHGLDLAFLEFSKGDGATGGTHEAMLDAWADYICKGLAAETTMGALKQAKGGNRTPLQLLRDGTVPKLRLMDDGTAEVSIDPRALELWEEYCAASHRRQQRHMSKNMLELNCQLSETAKMTEEEVAAQDLGGEPFAMIDSQEWIDQKMGRKACALAALGEEHGRSAIWEWLDHHRIDWREPKDLSPFVAAELDAYRATRSSRNAWGTT